MDCSKKHSKTLLRSLAAAVLLSLTFASCRTTQEFVYFKDAPADSVAHISGFSGLTIQPNDRLRIYVESETPEATKQYNQETNKVAVVGGTVLNPQNGNIQHPGYLVDDKGEIIFPVLGHLKVQGLTCDSLESYIEHLLVNGGHINDATVQVNLMNFKINVLGEVARPGSISVDGEKITIFEALSKAGDITVYGIREEVSVMREINGQRIVGHVDLTSKDIFDSPFYYLQQNDVVFVAPNKKRRNTSEVDFTSLQLISSSLSILSSAVLMVYYAWQMSKGKKE